jgi:ATP-dependent Clp protease ATP-binding subunit ClpA
MGKSFSPLGKCTDRAKRVLRLASALAIDRNHADIEAGDFLDALARNGGMGEGVLRHIGIEPNELPPKLPPISDEYIDRSPMARRLLEQAWVETQQLDHGYTGTAEQLLALTALCPDVFTNAAEVRQTVLEVLGQA